MRADRAVVVVGSFNRERVRAEAYTVHVARHGVDVKRLGIFPVLTERARQAVHIVRSADVDPHHRLTCLDLECSRCVLEIRCFHYDAFNTAGIVLGNHLVPKEEGDKPKEVKNFFHFNEVMTRQPRGAPKVHTRPAFS